MVAGVLLSSVTISSLKDLLSCLLGCERLECDDCLPFGHIALPLSQVFGATSLSFCSVNLKPFAPGHVMVLPRRPVPTLDRLLEEEMADLMRLTHRVVKMIKRCYHTQAVTVAVQDGPAAGQTVPHVSALVELHAGPCARHTQSVRRSARRLDLRYAGEGRPEARARRIPACE